MPGRNILCARSCLAFSAGYPERAMTASSTVVDAPAADVGVGPTAGVPLGVGPVDAGVDVGVAPGPQAATKSAAITAKINAGNRRFGSIVALQYSSCATRYEGIR